LDSATSQVLATAIFFVVARFVTPSEFGVVVGAMFVIELFRSAFVEPIATALLAQEHPGTEDYNACFWALLSISLVAATLISCFGGIIAQIISLPKLPEVLRAVALVLIGTGLVRTQEVWLSRHLRFRELTVRSVLSVALGGLTGGVLAFLGYGVWALVAQQLVGGAVSTALLWLVTPWRPTFQTNRSSFSQLYRDAKHLLAMNLTNFISSQSDVAFAARYLGPFPTGLYSAGKRIAAVLSNVISVPFARVATPTMANLSTDSARLRRAYLEAVTMTVALTAPAFAGVAMLAPELITVALGRQWVTAAPVLTAISGHYFLVTIGQYNFSVILVRQKAKWLTVVTGTYAVTTFVLLAIFARWGILVLASAITIRTIILSPLSTTMALRLLQLRWSVYLAAVAPAICCAFAMAMTVKLVSAEVASLPLIVRIAVLAAAGTATYTGLMLIVQRDLITRIHTTLQQSLART
jgi:O-antigen/teichoic acid export membrane protein